MPCTRSHLVAYGNSRRFSVARLRDGQVIASYEPPRSGYRSASVFPITSVTTHPYEVRLPLLHHWQAKCVICVCLSMQNQYLGLFSRWLRLEWAMLPSTYSNSDFLKTRNLCSIKYEGDYVSFIANLPRSRLIYDYLVGSVQPFFQRGNLRVVLFWDACPFFPIPFRGFFFAFFSWEPNVYKWRISCKCFAINLDS